MLLDIVVKLKLVEMAIKSGIYRETTTSQWFTHIDFCFRHHMAGLVYWRGIICGFYTWYRTDNYEDREMFLTGKYVVCPFFYIEPEYRGRVKFPHIVRYAILDCLDRNPGVECFIWQNDNRDSRHRTLRKTERGWKWEVKAEKR